MKKFLSLTLLVCSCSIIAMNNQNNFHTPKKNNQNNQDNQEQSTPTNNSNNPENDQNTPSPKTPAKKAAEAINEERAGINRIYDFFVEPSGDANMEIRNIFTDLNEMNNENRKRNTQRPNHVVTFDDFESFSKYDNNHLRNSIKSSMNETEIGAIQDAIKYNNYLLNKQTGGSLEHYIAKRPRPAQFFISKSSSSNSANSKKGINWKKFTKRLKKLLEKKNHACNPDKDFIKNNDDDFDDNNENNIIL